MQNIHLDDMSVATARTNLLAAMNGGTALVNFTGHSGTTSWTFSNLFNTDDAAALTNTGQAVRGGAVGLLEYLLCGLR